jgi:hypothetical protein
MLGGRKPNTSVFYLFPGCLKQDPSPKYALTSISWFRLADLASICPEREKAGSGFFVTKVA